MTIRKITGRTSSLAVKATVTQGGIFKAALQNPSSIKAAALDRLQKFPIENWDLSSADVDYDLDSSIILPWGSELDSSVTQEVNAFIPKIANVTARVIDHLLYDPDGFGIRHFYEILLLGEAIGRSIGKTNTDSFSLADSLLLNYSLGRNPADVQNTDDLIGFLLKTSRTFDDSAAAVSRPYLWFAPKTISDIQNFADSFFIARVKNFEDTLTGSDAFTRLAQSFRTFEDNVGMLDAFTFIDGSTFELRRRLSDTVSVNTTNLEVLRNTGNETENFSFFIDKVLDPDMELLSHVAKLGLKTITSIDITSADRPFLYTTKPATDSANPADTAPIFLGIKRLDDTETLDSLINFSVSKLLADTTTMLDNLAFGDQLAYDSTKLVADEIGSADRPFLYYAPRTVEDSLTATDTNRSRFIKASSDLIDLTESNTKLFAKNTGNILSLADILNIVRLKDYADVFTPADLSSFALTKIFADTVEADDPLVRLTDGNISLLIKQRQDTEPVDDYFARAVKFYRYPHHQDGGLGNFVPVLEKDSKFVSLRARAGALTTYPIIRTNLISWSEQFNADQNQGYWTSIGTRIISNQTAAPQNVVSSNSTTYDADQLQELFYNKPNNNYARSWYQLTPGRWIASSDGDLLIQDTSTGIHQLSTPNIPELIGTTNFGFAIHLKYAGHRYVRLWVTSFVNVDVDMVNNVVVATSAAKASMQPVGGGWFLVEVENRIVNFGIAPEMQILNEIFYNSTNSPYGLTQYKLVPDNIISSARIVLLDSSLNTTFTGNGTDGVYVWGAQLEVGDQPEQEVSSLRYIRTAGGSATRIGFSVTPTDNDRVFVGRIQRRGGNERGTDTNEILSFLLQYKVSAGDNLATPSDYFARSVRYFRNSIIEPGLGLSIAAGNSNSQRRYSNDPLELISFWFNKDAKKAGTSTATRQTIVRQNLLKYSERFDYDYWTKSNVLATTGISVIGGSLPYRNVVHDADQIHGLFYNKRYTYNQGRRWWDVTPLANKPDFTSNTIVDIFESSSNSIHTVQTFGFATNLSGDFFASSIYASPANGVTRFRLQVGSVFADFDLSSIAVLSSVGTLYNRIIQADTSTGWYLCTIIGPTQALGTLNFTGDAVIPTDLLQKLIPFRAAPDSILPTDQRPALFNNKAFADTTLMLSNFFIADGSTYTGNKQILDSFVAGTLEGFRTSGNQVENVKFLTKFVAHRSGEFTSLTIKLINDVRGSAAKVAEDVFVNRTNKTWFQLAPYYNSSVHIDDYPTDYDRVRIGTQSGGPRGSNDPFETINLLVSRFFVNKDSVATTDRKLGNYYIKQIDETKLIPTIPKFDAAAVAGLFYNTTRNIDGRRFTPQDGNYTYYAKTDWYSLAPRYARPRFGYGTGNTPGTIMIDNMQLGDDLTYLSQFNLKTTVLIGSPDGVRGTSDIENFSYNLNMRPRRGAFTDLYIAKLRPTKFDADQTAGIFWGSSNSTTSYTKLNPYGKRWYQLAPYYASYEHIKDTPGQYDFVRVGSVRGGQRHLGWPTEIMSLGILKTPYETSVTTDVRGNFFNLTALRGDTNAGTGYWTTRTNYISSSGVFTGADWIKSNITLSRNSEQIFYDPVSMGYRSTINDANQIAEMFYSPKNNTAGKRWYDIVPVRPQTLTPLILDKIPILTETTSVGQHYMETVVNKPVTADQYYLFRVIALTRSGTNNIRVYINNDYADFTLYGATAVSVSNTNMTSFTATYGAYGGALGLLGRTTSTSVTVRIQLIDQSGNTSYAGTTANSVWVWGAQLEFGEYFNPTNQILVYNSLKNPGDYYRNSWIKSTNGPTSRLYEIFGTDTRTDGVTIGLDQDARLGGSSRENVSFKTLLRARRSGNSTSILITLGSITRTSADQTAEVFDNIRTSTPIMNKWYQLAPYYRSSLYDRDTDYDAVRIGSQTLSKRTSSDPYETVSFWLAPKPLTDSSTATDVRTRQYIRKEFSETRMIPQNSRFDAARVAGIDLVSSGAQRININSYTPVTGSTTYYKSWDWFSEAPLSNRAIYALGNAGAGPIMLDNMSFGDNLTYSGTKLLSSIALTVGTQLGGARFSGDVAETQDVNLRKSAKQSTFTDLYIKNRRISPLDADQVLGLLYNSSNSTRSIIRNNPYRRRWYQLAPYYASYGHIKQSPQNTDRVILSYKELFQPWVIKGSNDIASTTGDGGTRKQTGQNSLETTRLDVQLFARRSALTTSNVVITTKTNWVTYSEDFTREYWGKSFAAVIQAPQLMSGLYPYRNTNYDAVQVANQFMLISTSSAFTRYNNYYNRAWYAPAPRTNRTAFSSTVLQYLTDQDAFGSHFMQATVQLRDYSIPEEWVTYSLHVQGQAGVRRFRMDVGRCFADFDLSSVSVITSTATVRFANIRFVDTSAGVFLCQIIAPIQTFPNTLIRFTVSSDTVTVGDDGINFLLRDRRTFDDAVVGTESIDNDKITDYHL